MKQNTNQNIDWTGKWEKKDCFSHPERTITIATTCSGIGAPEMALKKCGLNHEVVFACDIDKYVKKSYLANYPISEDQWFDDMTTLDATPYKGKVNIYFAGCCCQPFSLAGKRKGIEDPRGMLFEHFVRIVKECEPDVFFFENVANMLTIKNDKGESAWDVILPALKDTGYDIHYQVLNACDYGIPQSRKRVFVIGFKNKTNFLFPRPIELKTCIYDMLEDKTYDPEHPFRELTPRECLNLTGFPKEFKMVVPKTEVYHQAGNSSVVNVIEALYKQMDITNFAK